MNFKEATDLLISHIEFEIESDLLPEKDEEDITELEQAIKIIREEMQWPPAIHAHTSKEKAGYTTQWVSATVTHPWPSRELNESA